MIRFTEDGFASDTGYPAWAAATLGGFVYILPWVLSWVYRGHRLEDYVHHPVVAFAALATAVASGWRSHVVGDTIARRITAHRSCLGIPWGKRGYDFDQIRLVEVVHHVWEDRRRGDSYSYKVWLHIRAGRSHLMANVPSRRGTHEELIAIGKRIAEMTGARFGAGVHG